MWLKAFFDIGEVKYTSNEGILEMVKWLDHALRMLEYMETVTTERVTCISTYWEYSWSRNLELMDWPTSRWPNFGIYFRIGMYRFSTRSILDRTS